MAAAAKAWLSALPPPKRRRAQRIDQHRQPVPSPPPPATISPDASATQKRAIEAVLAGHSVLITGAAGTGKSFVLHELARLLPKHSTFITASSGVAAARAGKGRRRPGALPSV